MIGVFFSGITPSNSGGQFAQAYTFSKQNIKITNAASILFMHFILYQIVLVLFGGAVMIFKFNEMRGLTEVIPIFGINFDIISLAFVGFAINTLVIVGLFFLAFSSKFHNFLIKYGIGLLAKLHIVKNKDEQCNVTADLSLQRQFPFQDSQRVQINRHKNRVMDFFADRYI